MMGAGCIAGSTEVFAGLEKVGEDIAFLLFFLFYFNSKPKSLFFLPA